MAININNILITTSGGAVTIADSGNNKLYEQSSAGVVNMPRTSAGATLLPMFNVGMGSGSWTSIATGVVIFNYTGGSGYLNVGGCYNTTNGRFTAPWTGIYLFKQHIYIYGNNTTYTWYTHPLYLVNGSTSARRPAGTPYRIRLYGIYASYGQDTDCCELLYLTAGDYVQVYQATNGTVQGNAQYSAWSGAYLGD